MIERYEVADISAIWTDESKFSAYLQAELAILKAMEGNLVPQGISEKFQSVQIRPERITEIEAVTRHDVIAFCTSITEQVDEESSKWFHFGITSSDIIDTATTIQIRSALQVIKKDFKALLEAMAERANKHQTLPCLGRSHGREAEPMSFGLKFLSSYCELYRAYEKLESFMNDELTGQFSGAVGNYTIINPDVERSALEALGLKVEPVSTQVIPRDRMASLCSVAALFASALERISVEIRHLHHSDLNEVHEGFAKGQKGSSIMPHKKNPIATENLTGMARMIRSYLTVAHENVALWHERDISHSSTERLYLPDLTGLWSYSLRRLTKTIQNLEVHEDHVSSKVDSSFHYLSSAVLHTLLRSFPDKRETFYPVVQKAAFEATDRDTFLELVRGELKSLGRDDSVIKSEDYSVDRYLRHAADVFKRSFERYPLAALRG